MGFAALVYLYAHLEWLGWVLGYILWDDEVFNTFIHILVGAVILGCLVSICSFFLFLFSITCHPSTTFYFAHRVSCLFMDDFFARTFINGTSVDFPPVLNVIILKQLLSRVSSTIH